MFTPIIRIILVISCIGMSIFFYSKNDFTNMAMTILAAGLFAYGYFQYGTVYAAFNQLKKNNFKKAEKLIAKVKNPRYLAKSHKSYYHFTKGIIAFENGDCDYGYSELTKALEIGLRTKNDTSIVLLNLAEIEFERKKLKEAEAFLKQLKEFKLKPLVKVEVDKLIEKINVERQKTELKN
ncbi:hypothetical protein QSV08_16960 [Maribacter sp. BPC-D8]|uniref:tetratricopeptide repeat protein n=1 Tax=Maribacter sp. BPC-D8 TaxID=3053613 RepID=UPI002B494F35|nr:hypothetical protein [Maribacter sp. BPC-D8]WRI28898.1 hypothetical protein QSV08_16960 [Maribacter sp. BPC-D8]